MDIESQSSHEDEGLADERVFVSLRREQIAWWKANVGTKPVCSSGPYHSHGLLSAARMVLEKEACEKLLERYPDATIVDVGGCPKRTSKHLAGRGWYQCPLLQPGDQRRWDECPQGVRQFCCRHTLEECDCLATKQTIAYLLVHSAQYYSDPLKLWQRLATPNCAELSAFITSLMICMVVSVMSAIGR